MTNEFITSNLKDQWLVALRSNEYKQGTGWLRKADSYCCLGVLCDIIDNTKWEKGDIIFSYSYGNEYSIPNNMLSSNIQQRLLEMNDKEGKSFNQIADWIEKNIHV